MVLEALVAGDVSEREEEMVDVVVVGVIGGSSLANEFVEGGEQRGRS